LRICCGRPLLHDWSLIVTFRGLRGVLTRLPATSGFFTLWPLNCEYSAESNSSARRKLWLASPKLLITLFKPLLVWRIKDLNLFATSGQAIIYVMTLTQVISSSTAIPGTLGVSYFFTQPTRQFYFTKKMNRNIDLQKFPWRPFF